MKKPVARYVLRTSAVAIASALLSLCATTPAQAADSASSAADEPTVADLTGHASKVEVGIGNVGRSSAKFGEYNGLNNDGPFGIAGIDLRGGGAYDSNDATRWRLIGTDIGLENRNITGEYGVQGKFRLNYSYDELLRNKSDTFQTPYSGAGTNTLTLPGNWRAPVIPNSALGTTSSFRGLIPGIASVPFIGTAGVLVTPSAANQASVNAAQAADLPAFHNLNLFTKRTAIEGGFSYTLDNRWELQATARTEKKDGLKAMGALNVSTSPSSIIPDLIDQRTNLVNLSLNYRENRNFTQFAYNGSFFKNGVTQMNFQNPFNTAQTSDISSPPSNQFHQLAYTGSYSIAKTTRLAVNAAYSRSSQNESLINDGTATLPAGLPVTSANALVVNQAFNFKLTDKTTDKLNLTGGFKYDNRDNRTPVNTYAFYDAAEARAVGNGGIGAGLGSPFNTALGLPLNTLGSNINIYANRAYSKKLSELTFDADYNLAKGHWLKGGAEYQQIDRSCAGSWINCADATRTREATLRGEWRAAAMEDLNTKLGYAYSKRLVKYDENAWLALVPMANVVPTGATQSVYSFMQQNGVGGYGFNGPFSAFTGNAQLFFPNNSALQQGWYGSRNDIHELPGMRRYNMADRDRNKMKASMDWQATQKLNIFAGADLNYDNYGNSTYGLTKSEGKTLNLDGTYAMSEDLSFNMFYSYENQKSASAGMSYSASALSSTTFVGLAANTAVSGGCYSTVAQVNANAKIDPCRNWSTDMRDRTDTLGIGFRHKNLLAGKLDLRGDLVRSFARSDVGVTGGNYVNNPYALAGGPAVATAIFYIPAAALPTVSSDNLTMTLRGQYTLDKKSSIHTMYRFQRLRASDYAYDAMQIGDTINTVLPTNEQAPAYTIQVIGASYQYRF